MIDPAGAAYAHWQDGLRSEPRDQPAAAARARALRPDVPAHHLEAFVQGGPLRQAAQVGVQDVVLVDGSSYFR